MTQNNTKLSGKLELNWVNKNKTLIVKDYEKGSYEWVDRNDYRVSEVRLLKEFGKKFIVLATTQSFLVATQLEYDYQPDNEHFCGKKGDVLLAVVEGMLTEGLLNFLLNSKAGDEFLEIAALAVDPDLDDKKFSNIRIGRIPNNILRHYARI